MNSTTITALITLAFALLAVFSGYKLGYHEAERAALKAQSQAVARAITQANALSAEDAAILRASEATRTLTRTRTVYRTKEAARHVAENPDLYSRRLDACGLCLARSAAADTGASACPCRADGAVPAAGKAR